MVGTAETENQALDVEALKRLVESERTKDTRFVPMAHHEVDAIIAALERAARLEATAKLTVTRYRECVERAEPLCARATACGAILRAALAPAPTEEGR